MWLLPCWLVILTTASCPEQGTLANISSTLWTRRNVSPRSTWWYELIRSKFNLFFFGFKKIDFLNNFFAADWKAENCPWPGNNVEIRADPRRCQQCQNHRPKWSSRSSTEHPPIALLRWITACTGSLGQTQAQRGHSFVQLNLMGKLQRIATIYFNELSMGRWILLFS